MMTCATAPLHLSDACRTCYCTSHTCYVLHVLLECASYPCYVYHACPPEQVRLRFKKRSEAVLSRIQEALSEQNYRRCLVTAIVSSKSLVGGGAHRAQLPQDPP